MTKYGGPTCPQKVKNNETERNKIYTVIGLFREPKEKSSKPKFTFSDIAKHAAKKAQRT